jgi:hypothetical protein
VGACIPPKLINSKLLFLHFEFCSRSGAERSCLNFELLRSGGLSRRMRNTLK